MEKWETVGIKELGVGKDVNPDNYKMVNFLLAAVLCSPSEEVY